MIITIYSLSKLPVTGVLGSMTLTTCQLCVGAWQTWIWGSPEMTGAEWAPLGEGEVGAWHGEGSQPGNRVSQAQHQRLPLAGIRASWAYLPSLYRRMGCVKSKFLRNGGKVAKTEPNTNPQNPVYVPDPTSSGKRVSGGWKGTPAAIRGCPTLPQTALTVPCSPKGEQGEFGVKRSWPVTNSALTPQDMPAPSTWGKGITAACPAAQALALQPGWPRPGGMAGLPTWAVPGISAEGNERAA